MKRKVLLFFSLALLVAGLIIFYLHQPGVPAKTTEKGVVEPSSSKEGALLREEIQKKRQSTGLRVMMIGWDAADWQIIDPLLRSGKMPNLQKLLRNGARAYMRSSKPMLSPLLWNSIATGKRPTEHGILDFLVLEPRTKKLTPMNSTFRKSMALWNMATEAGDTSAFVAWWATWPAEHTKGVMVTDRVSYSLFSSVAQTAPSAGLTWPENYYNEVKPRLISEKDVTDQELAKFIHLTPMEISAERQKVYPGGKTNPVSYLAQVLASTRNYYTISLDLLSRNQYDLFSCYFEGIDQVGHLFQHMMPPKMEMATEEEFHRYKDVVPLFYQFLDGLTGDLVDRAGKDTVVVLISDHGFKNGADRPTDVLPYISEKPAYWHREYGIFVLSGEPVRKNASIDVVTVYDAAPTILYLLGLPVGKDLPGKVLSDALNPAFGKKFPVQNIASWEPLKSSSVTAPQQTSNVDSEMMENLSALGYISKGNSTTASGQETASFHNNMAMAYFSDKQYDHAEREIKKSLQQGPNLETYEILFEIKKDQRKIDEAGTALEEGFDRFSTVPPDYFVKLIDFYAENKRIDSGKQSLQKYGSRLPSEAYRVFCTARLQEGAGEVQVAESGYLTALQLDPGFSYAMERLYQIYKVSGNLEKLEAPARDGLRRNDQLALYHNVLGVVYKRRGNLQEAVKEYERAISIEPDNSTYWANLAAAYLSMSRPQEALEFLLRAKAKDDQNPEIWLNLGAVYGSLGRNDDALNAFLKARELAGDSPNIELGIAVTYAQKGDLAQAAQVAQNALIKYPNDPGLQELLNELKNQR